MKKALLLVLLTSFLCHGQEEEETFKPHLEKKNELRISIENYLTTIEYERQITDHLSLGAVYRKGNGDEYGYSDFNLDETLHLGVRGRYYFKHFITHSFYYLFFDDKVKIRYFTEGNLGYSKINERPFSERYLDDSSNYVIHRVQDSKANHATGNLGVGFKMLYDEIFSVEFSLGGGQILTKEDYDGFSYYRFGFGFRF